MYKRELFISILFLSLFVYKQFGQKYNKNLIIKLIIIIFVSQICHIKNTEFIADSDCPKGYKQFKYDDNLCCKGTYPLCKPGEEFKDGKYERLCRKDPSKKIYDSEIDITKFDSCSGIGATIYMSKNNKGSKINLKPGFYLESRLKKNPIYEENGILSISVYKGFEILLFKGKTLNSDFLRFPRLINEGRQDTSDYNIEGNFENNINSLIVREIAWNNYIKYDNTDVIDKTIKNGDKNVFNPMHSVDEENEKDKDKKDINRLYTKYSNNPTCIECTNMCDHDEDCNVAICSANSSTNLGEDSSNYCWLGSSFGNQKEPVMEDGELKIKLTSNVTSNNDSVLLQKVPPNYDIIYANTGKSYDDLALNNNNELKELSKNGENLSINECAVMCNTNVNCNAFTVDYTDGGKYKGCNFYKRFDKYTSSPDYKKISFKKNKNYSKNNAGDICKNPFSKMNDKKEVLKMNIKEKKTMIENKHNKQLKEIDFQNDNILNDMKDTAFNLATKEVMQFYSNPLNIIEWENVNIRGNKVKIMIENKSQSLMISNIQIYGKEISNPSNKELKNIDWTNNKNTIIKMSSIEDKIKHNEAYGIDNNLDTYCKTEFEEEPYIEIQFNDKDDNDEYIEKDIDIEKIIIWNVNTDNTSELNEMDKTNIYPLKIIIYDQYDYEIKFAKKINLSSNLIISKDLPDLPKHLSDKNKKEVYDTFPIKGLIDHYQGWANVTNTKSNNNKDDFCRVLYDKDTKEKYLKCTPYNNGEPVNSDRKSEYFSKPGIEVGIPNTAYMKDVTNNNLDDYCRCIGTPPNTTISCLKAEEHGFTEEDLKSRIESDCSSMTSDDIKNSNESGNVEVCKYKDEYLDTLKYRVDAAFYWKKENAYYLFKNTSIGGKNIVLFVKVNIQKDSNGTFSSEIIIKNKYPAIVNENTWPGLNFIHGSDVFNNNLSYIDCVLYNGKDQLYFFKQDRCVLYDLNDLNQVSCKSEYIWKVFPGIDRKTFGKKLDAAMYIEYQGKQRCIFFSGSKMIDYDLIRKTLSGADVRSISSSSTITRWPGMSFTNIDAVVCFYDDDAGMTYFFNENTYIKYNTWEYKADGTNIYDNIQAVKKIKEKSEWLNMWNINVDVIKSKVHQKKSVNKEQHNKHCKEIEEKMLQETELTKNEFMQKILQKANNKYSFKYNQIDSFLNDKKSQKIKIKKKLDDKNINIEHFKERSTEKLGYALSLLEKAIREKNEAIIKDSETLLNNADIEINKYNKLVLDYTKIRTDYIDIIKQEEYGKINLKVLNINKATYMEAVKNKYSKNYKININEIKLDIGDILPNIKKSVPRPSQINVNKIIGYIDPPVHSDFSIIKKEILSKYNIPENIQLIMNKQDKFDKSKYDNTALEWVKRQQVNKDGLPLFTSDDPFSGFGDISQSCNSHTECAEENTFCYSGQCASCNECYYNQDGIDYTCGKCDPNKYPLYEGDSERISRGERDNMKEKNKGRIRSRFQEDVQSGKYSSSQLSEIENLLRQQKQDTKPGFSTGQHKGIGSLTNDIIDSIIFSGNLQKFLNQRGWTLNEFSNIIGKSVNEIIAENKKGSFNNHEQLSKFINK